MKSKAVLAGVMAMSMTLGDFAFAEGNDRQYERGRNEQAPRGSQDGQREQARQDQARQQQEQARQQQARYANEQRDRDRQEQVRRAYEQGDRQRQEQARYGNERRGYEQDRRGPGAGPNHNFYRGERLTRDYHHRYYVVDDWRGHDLHRPQRGYHWVQTGADYVLVAIATGIILEVLLSR